MAAQANLAGEVQRGAFSVNGVLCETVERRDGHEQGSELGVIDHIEVQFLLTDWRGDVEIQRNHRWRSAKFSGDRCEVIAGNGADRAANIDDFRGCEIGRECGEDSAACHRELDGTKIEKGMAAEKNTVSLHGGDSAGGVDGRVALHQDHSSHVAGNEMGVFRAGRGRAALCRDEAVALDLRSELLQRGGLKAGED